MQSRVLNWLLPALLLLGAQLSFAEDEAAPPEPAPATVTSPAPAFRPAPRAYDACIQGSASDMRLVRAFRSAKNDSVVAAFRQDRLLATIPLPFETPPDAPLASRVPPLEPPELPEMPEAEPEGSEDGLRELATSAEEPKGLDEAKELAAAAAQSEEGVPPVLTPGANNCPLCDAGIEKMTNFIQSTVNALKPFTQRLGLNYPLVKKRIRMDCIEASLRRSTATKGYYCATEKDRRVYSGAPGPDGPCITLDLAEYMQFATQQAVECLSRPGDPIDPRVIFKKINNESAFHFYQAYIGGAGFGQLTSDAVKQLGDDRHNTEFLIERVLNNPNPACKPFKSIVQADLTLGRTPSPKDSCYWIAPERGLARNIIFSLGYYAYLRDLLRKNNPRIKSESLDYVALVAFGPKGSRHGDSVARKNLKGPAQVVTQSRYLRQTEDKWKMVRRDLGGRETDMLADGCVENLP